MNDELISKVRGIITRLEVEGCTKTAYSLRQIIQCSRNGEIFQNVSCFEGLEVSAESSLLSVNHSAPRMLQVKARN